MDDNINIADILQDKPKGTTLYSPAFGHVILSCIYDDDSKFRIEVLDKEYIYYKFTESGKLSKGGECMLFPSEQMREWEKYQWKQGDVLVDKFGKHCIFKSWSKLEYTQFSSLRTYGFEKQTTSTWTKEVDKDVAQRYISEVERAKGDKLGSILEIKNRSSVHDSSLSCFQPFQRVLVRNARDEIWLPRLFAYYGDTYVVCTDGCDYQLHIPYNDQTKHLLGTTEYWIECEVGEFKSL